MRFDAEEFCPNFDIEQVDIALTENQQLQSEFMVKHKTELCKNFMSTGVCKFIEICAFAHGTVELKKKTHVPVKYRLAKCDGYHKAPFVCDYGDRCQFMHTQRERVETNEQLLTENAYQFNCRTANIENPEFTIFNVADSDAKRLPVFEEIFDPITEKKRPSSRRGKKQQKSKK